MRLARRRSVTAVLVAAAVALPATPALASVHAASDGLRRPASEISVVARPGSKRPVNVTLTGTLASVDPAARTVTFVVRGGHGDPRALRGDDLTLSVPARAAVRRDGATAELADLEPGDRVQVRGVRLGTRITVQRLTARSTPSAERPEQPESQG